MAILLSSTSFTSGSMWARLEVMMTPPPKHIIQERILVSLGLPSDSFLLIQPLRTATIGTRPMIQVARPSINIDTILEARR